MAKNTKKRPWHLWIVCIFFFLLYVGGVRDYLMIHFNGSSYFESQNYNADQIAYFTNYPLLPDIFWGMNMITAVISPVLLFFRSRYAVVFAGIALISLVVLHLITFIFMDRFNMLGLLMALFDMVVLVLTSGFFLYSYLYCKINKIK